MEVLKQATADYLLDAGIETLHQQSIEWLEDIAFWRDETAFLYALEVSKTLKDVPVAAKAKLEKIDKELIRISGGDLDDLYKKVEEHEEYLDAILSSKREDEEIYRNKHKQIAADVAKLANRIKALKMEIFEIAKLSKK